MGKIQGSDHAALEKGGWGWHGFKEKEPNELHVMKYIAYIGVDALVNVWDKKRNQ